ncbi:GntR family transcriptional regulator [Robertmurraya yapensis]|uniref:GntR family transcriptional regulator n=1 Tax=Bacillus yapensis TaxID=2492960 RepID=A0A431WM32_9BACI|nr:GntR family transcriptional regulator [Bacillus yapensis]RTR36349.1 GntR family transcriptional regulator [Bacillus yapensis]TKT05852.1 GntR family transcriptional regulator [Bacillus yapensis]
MAQNKFLHIYEILKARIANNYYSDTMLLPTEMTLVEEFNVSRNTVRRAIQKLNEDGLVYSVKGRGVVILESTKKDNMYVPLSNFQGFNTLHTNKKSESKSIVKSFSEIIIDEDLAERTSFDAGETAYFIERIRIVDGVRVMYDTSYFRANIVENLTEEIAHGSIYSYIRETIGIQIASAKTFLKVETANAKDMDYLDLEGNNCVGVAENLVYTDMGKLFEYTEIRFIPNKFVITNFAQNVND